MAKNNQFSLHITLVFILLLLLTVSCGSESATSEDSSTTPASENGTQLELPAASNSESKPIQIEATVTQSTATAQVPAPAATSITTTTDNRIQIPLTVVDESEPTAAPQPTPSATPIYSGPPLDKNDIGVQIHLHREDLDWIMNQLETLGVGWVKVQVSWKIYEPQDGIYDEYRFGELDRLVADANESDIKVMLGVAKAPEWSRTTTELDGPPTDFQHFGSFMNFLAERYQGQVQAYELWNEANLQREWYGAPLNPGDVVSLIRAGAEGAKAADPEVALISGAPAPTGINDGISALEDRSFLQGMLDSGLTEVVDVIGVHPYGWANPPGSSAANPDPSVPTHNDHPSFFFADTILDYRAILDARGLTQTPLWATEFGWGSCQGLGVDPPAGVEYMAFVDEGQQALYTVQAYQMADEWPTVGPMILWNLNFAPTFGTEFVESAYSLLRPDGSPRPIFQSIASISEPR